MVAAMTLKSDRIDSVPPTRSNVPSCTTLRSLTCTFGARSPISSKKIVPPSASSKPALLFLVSAGESPLFVAEELAGNEFRRQGREIDRYEGTVLSLAQAVNRLRHQFLSDSCLPQYENRAVRSGHLSYLVYDGSHRFGGSRRWLRWVPPSPSPSCKRPLLLRGDPSVPSTPRMS